MNLPEIRIANPIASYGQGALTAGQVAQVQDANALRQVYAQHGAGIVNGDQGAINALALLRPDMAQDFISTQHGMAATDRRLAQADRGLDQGDQRISLDRERLAFQQAQVRAETARAAARLAQEGRQMELMQEANETRALFSAGEAAFRSGQLEEWAQQNAPLLNEAGLNPADVSEESWPILRASLAGMDEAFIDVLGTIDDMQPMPGQQETSFIVSGESAGQYGLPTDGSAFNVTTGPNSVRATSIGGTSGGTGLRVGPDGTMEFVQGDVRFTEGQSKDNVYATRMEGALTALEQQDGSGQPIIDNLASRSQRVAEAVPLGVGREFQSPDFQVAMQAGEEFLSALLRKDTGAAITDSEMENYGSIYLPQPGDSAEVLETKRVSRARALEAVRSGMNAQQILATERAQRQTSARTSGYVPPQGASQRAATREVSSDFSGMGIDQLLTIDFNQLSTAELDAFNARMEELSGG